MRAIIFSLRDTKYLCRRGKYRFTMGNELQHSRSGWFSYSSDVQVQNFSHSTL
ncbi:unnamed protein product [Prunus brigantina]